MALVGMALGRPATGVLAGEHRCVYVAPSDAGALRASSLPPSPALRAGFRDGAAQRLHQHEPARALDLHVAAV